MPGKSTVVRGLRFPEFIRQPLQEVRLGDVTAECAVRNGDELRSSSVMGVSKVDGIVPMEERVIASDIARYKLVRKDWFAYNPMRLNIGSIARWKAEADILVSPDYVVFRCLDDPASGLEPNYLDHFRRSILWDAFVSEGGDGGVRVRIYYKDLARLELALPLRAEQKKIADCMTSLDEVVAAQGRKLELLKAHKRGLMQQLFPREGETFPRLRFSEFRDAPEWKYREIGDICETLNNSRVPISSRDRKVGPYPYYGASGIVDFVDRFIFDERVVLVGEDGAKWGAFEKTAFVVDGKCWVNNHAHVLRCVGVDDKLLESYLTMTDIGAHVTGNAPPKLTLGKLKSIHVPSPESEAEQQRIGSCFSAFDTQIAVEALKLAALKAHKEGLMRQLFTSPAEV